MCTPPQTCQVGRDRQRLAELEAQVAAAEGGLRELDDAMKELQSQMEQMATEVGAGTICTFHTIRTSSFTSPGRMCS